MNDANWLEFGFVPLVLSSTAVYDSMSFRKSCLKLT